jgi:hypothetical protein
LTGGVPTISFRDLAIQRRENDLVGATFGRGFYILDDYTVLRHVSEEKLRQEATLFPARKAWWYIERPVLGFSEKGSQGASYFTAPNPPFGAVFTYYLKEDIKRREDTRKEKEKPLIEKNQDVPFPGWDAVEAERRQDSAKIWLTIRDGNDMVVRRIEGPVEKGFHRVAWDLRYPSTAAIDLKIDEDDEEPTGMLALPGQYSVSLRRQVDGVVKELSDHVTFTVEHLREGALEGADPSEAAAFWQQIARLQRTFSASSTSLDRALKRVEKLKIVLERTPEHPGLLDTRLHDIRQTLLELDEQFGGNRSKRQVGEKRDPTFNDRLNFAYSGIRYSTYGPTPSHRKSLEIAEADFLKFKEELDMVLLQQLPALERDMQAAGAPWLEGQEIPEIE